MAFDKALALNAAKQLTLRGDYNAAIETYRKIIEADPSDLASLNALGDVYLRAGRGRQAAAEFAKLADVYLTGGFMRKAIAVLKKIMVVDPGNTDTWIKLADVYAKAGLPTEARQHYLQIADAYSRKGQMREALAAYGKVVDLDPSNASTRIRLGELYIREGMKDQAYEAFIFAARQLAARGERRRALNAFNEALAIKPNSPEALEALSKLAEGHGGLSNTPSMTGALGRSMAEAATASGDLDPVHDSPDAGRVTEDTSLVVREISKAEILVGRGQVDQAVSMLKSVVQRFPDNVDVRVKLKDIYLRNGMTSEGAAECRELERIHRALGDESRARDYAVRANRLTQLIEQPSGDLRETEQAAPQSLGDESAGHARSTLESVPTPPRPQVPVYPTPPTVRPVAPPQSKPEAPIHRAPPTVKPVAPPQPKPEVPVYSAPPTVKPVVPPQSKPEAQPLVTAKIPESIAIVVADSPGSMSLVPLGDRVLEAPTSRERPFHLTPLRPDEVASTALAKTVPISTPVSARRSRFLMAAIAAGVAVVVSTGALIGGFVFNSKPSRPVEAASVAEAPQITNPEPVSSTPDEPSPAQAAESMTIVATPGEKPAQPPRKESTEAKPVPKELPAPSRATGVAPRETAQPSPPAPAPPRTTVNPGNQAPGENRTPAGLTGAVPAGVPAGAPPPVEPSAKPLRVSGGVVLGGAFRRVEPAYPANAKVARQSGPVQVEVSIDERGNVTGARALSGPSLLRNAAVAAAMGWKFKPSLLGGVPVKTTTVIVFNFKL